MDALAKLISMRQVGLAALAAAGCAGAMSVLAAVPDERGGGYVPPAQPLPTMPRVPTTPGPVSVSLDQDSQDLFRIGRHKRPGGRARVQVPDRYRRELP
jgi:hypothetical protein